MGSRSERRGVRRIAQGAGMALLAMILVAGTIQAIDPGDQLHQGQDLVDHATLAIDGVVDRVSAGPLERDPLYAEVRGLLHWVAEFDSTIAERYRLGSAEAILITDGIADTLATRLHDLLGQYVEAHPEEILDRGREALEIALVRMELPPGRLLGFHLLNMARLYGMQADTILSVPELALPGVKDGFLRHVWDLSQVYAQVHSDPAQNYFCRLSQEDWMASRIVCAHCGHRGVDYTNQMTGIREDSTEACIEAMDMTRTDPEVVLQRIDCRHWGHIFTATCPECGEEFKFSVPLPYYRKMQRALATGALETVPLPEDRYLHLGE
ncbi:MAG: hypothetical protein GF330_05395 [Candidatus Eisenbacteria bacterium]|nr:hypothetical protein [Candidatus Eisenbacteria bacterium]